VRGPAGWARRTSQDTVELVGQLAAEFDDAQIARILNKQGRRSGRGIPFTKAAITSLAIFIACLGLYGLAAFTTEQRTKEIGIRKVMGGSVKDIVLLLTGDFSKLVILSNLLAWPAAWYLMSRWLESFAYRIDLNLLPFVAAALTALIIAWLTVGGLAARAAWGTPATSLRYE